MTTDARGASTPTPDRPSGRTAEVHLGTCGDCYVWSGTRGSAHDPAQCWNLTPTIERLEREIEDKQRRLDSLRATRQSAEVPDA